MKRALILSVVALLSTLLVAMDGPAPAHAQRVRVGMKAPQMVDADTARLKGRVTGRDAVKIQRYAAGKKRWVGVKRVRVNNRGVFRTGVRATDRAVRYRAKAGRVKSRSRLVRAPAPIIPDQAPAPSDACGPQPLKLDGKRWSCTFTEDFAGAELDPAKWSAMTTMSQGIVKPECRVDTPENISVADGTLRLSARRESSEILCATSTEQYRTPYTAGAVTTARKFAQAYGRVEIRAKMPGYNGVGFHSALWMYPQNPQYGAWPGSGEIDLMEYRTGLYGRAVPTLHHLREGQHESITNWRCSLPKPEKYHTYVLEWTPDQIRFVYDGAQCLSYDLTANSPHPYDQPFFLIMNQSNGVGHNAPDSRTPSQGRMTVDYVRVWK